MITHPILTELANHGVRMGIGALKAFLSHTGVSTKQFPFVIHVGGTNGKGSVCRMLEAMYRDAGYSVGLYTSPHLQNVNERIRVQGMDISDGNLDRLLRDTHDQAVEWSNTEGFDLDVPLTYFELMTATAIRCFAEERVDVVILEVGLGGRLDATNILRSTVSCIVSIDYDHTDVLGTDLSSIATEKAGIIEQEQVVVIGNMDDNANRVIRFIAENKASMVHQLGEDFHFTETTEGLHFQSEEFRLEDVRVGLVGAHQKHNAALALQIVHSQQCVRPVSIPSMLRGLSSVVHPGRLEWVSKDLLVDAAHNPAGAKKLYDYLQDIRQQSEHSLPITLMLGCSSGKDIRSIGVILAPAVDRIFTTHCRHPRALSSTDVAREIKGGTPVFDMGAVEEAISHCRWGEELVVVAGSIFLVGAVRSIVRSSIDQTLPEVLPSIDRT